MADDITTLPEASTEMPAGLEEFISTPAPPQAAASPSEPEGLDSFIEPELKQQKYGTPLETFKATAEGAASAATFGLSTGLETALGVSPEDIRAREEANPIAHGLGEAAGLVGSAFVPVVGAAGLLGKAGSVAAKAAGLGVAESYAAKVGSAVVKGAVENALFQGGNELHKMFAQDPNQTAQTAVTDLGLAALLGGGISGAATGVISPLWKAAQGSKVAAMLKTITNKAGGIEGAVPSAVEDMIQTTGIEVAPEVRALMADDPHIQEMALKLQQSGTESGVKLREAVQATRTQAGESIAATLGKTPDEIASLASLSEAEAGHNLKQTLVSNLKEQMDPISTKFEAIKERFKKTELPAARKAEIADQIAKVSTEKGYALSASAPGTKIINDILEELPGLKTLEDLRRYQSVIGEKVSDKQLWSLGKDLRGIFRSTEDAVLERTLGEKAPELVAAHAEARSAYKAAMDTIDNLNDRLHVGRYSGPKSFINALSEMGPEDVLRRLSPKGDAEVVGLLAERFPGASEALRDYHLSSVLKSSSAKASPDELLNLKTLFAGLDKMSPEMRNFVISPEALQKIDAVRKLVEAIPSKSRPYPGVKAMEQLLSHIPGSAAGYVTGALSHNPTVGAVVFGLSTLLKSAPDSMRLSLLKFLGSNQSVKAEGFKAMADYVSATIRGESLTGKAVKNVFTAGREILPQLLPHDRNREKLDKALKHYQDNPEGLIDVGGDTGHYLPEHNTAMGEIAGRAVNYLNNLRPDLQKKAPLDNDPVISAPQKAAYNRALGIAQQPLSVLNHIKAGTLTHQDVQAVQTMYPDLYNKLVLQLNEQIFNQMQKKQPIPYQTRMGLSVFLAHPLDSTMTSSAIQAAQPKPPQMQPQTATQPASGPKHSMNALNKLPNQYQTSVQRREQMRTSGK